MRTIKELLPIWGVALAVFFLIIGLNHIFFGDQIEKDTFKPLFIIIPIMVGVILSIIKLSKNK